MPNYCDFSLKAVGSKESLKTLASYLNNKGDKSFYRIFDVSQGTCDTDYINHEHDDVYSLSMAGYCAWSVYSCMMIGAATYYSVDRADYFRKHETLNGFTGTHLVECAKDLDLKIEIFSSEYGIGFEEHLLIDNTGEILIDDCVDVTYHSTCDCEEAEVDALIASGRFTEADYDEDEDAFITGGFKNIGFAI